MGTKRQEALLKAGLEYKLDYNPSDWIIMQAICHRWNDHQIRPLRIAFPDLLDCTPYKFRKRGGLTVKKALRRLCEAEVLHVEDNGKRYEKDLVLDISVAWQAFHDCLEDMGKQKKKEPSNRHNPVESVQMKRAQNGSANEMHSSANETRSRNGSANEMHSSANETRSHSRHKEVKDLKKKESEKALVVQVKHKTSGNVPDKFFNGIEPTKLDHITSTRLNDLMHIGTHEEKEWARATFQRLRNEKQDDEAIPLTFN